MNQIKALTNTDTFTWPDEFIKVYLNNYLAGQENEGCIGKLDSEVVLFKVQDSNKDIETTTCSLSIPDIIGLSQTATLPAKLKFCVGVRVMLTDNTDNIGTVKLLDKRSKLLRSTIYVKLGEPKVGNSLKDRRLRGELKECVPITARTTRFPLKKGKSNFR